MLERKINSGVIAVDRGMEGFVKINVEEFVELHRLSPTLKYSLKKAIRNGVAPVEDRSSGKLASLYNLLCDMYGIPKAFLSKNSKEVCVYEPTNGLIDEFNAMHLISGGKRKVEQYGDHFKEYFTLVTEKVLIEMIAKYRPVPEALVEKALATIDRGESISFTPHTVHF